jgi:Phage major capsid protein E
MALTVYSTASMIGIVASLRRRSSFILDMFFGQYVGPTGQREIFFDIENDVLGVAPFASPLKEGRVVAEAGYQTKSFTPAYVKPKMPLDPFGPISRSMGEPLLGNLSPAQREAARVAKGFNDLMGLCYRRLELMAVEAITTGTNVVTGDGFPSVVVNYGRAAGHTKTLGSTVEWGDAGVSPVSDLDDWMMEIATATGVQPDIVVMDAKSWKLYEADPLFEKRRDTTLATLPGSGTAADPGLSTGVEGGILKATLGGGRIRIYVYNQVYKNAAGTVVNMIDDFRVLIGTSDPRCQGTRHFGTIVDPGLGYESNALTDPDTGAIIEFAPKTWVTDDPAQRFLMVQCAPLTALTRPNATMSVKVKT